MAQKSSHLGSRMSRITTDPDPTPDQSSDGTTTPEAIFPARFNFHSSTWPLLGNGSPEENFTIGVDAHGNESDISDTHTTSDDEPDLIFEPIDPPDGYLPLNFRPRMLTPTILWAIFVFYAATFVVLGYLAYRSHRGWTWTIQNVNYYLAARYLPALIGVATTLLFSNTTKTLRRMLPFINMADQNRKPENRYQVNQTLCARYFPYARFPNGWIINCLIIGQLLVGLTISFKATLLDVQESGDGHWFVSVRLVPAVSLAAIYLLIGLITAFIALTYAKRNTGLKQDWDPTSLADMVLLFATADDTPKTMWTSKLTYRIGYWEIINTGESKPPIVYGIRHIANVEPIETLDFLEQFKVHMYQQGSLLSYCYHLANLRHTLDGSSQPETASMSSTDCCERFPKCVHYPYQRGPFIVWIGAILFYLVFLLTLVVCLTYALIRVWGSDGIILQRNTWLIQSDNITSPSNGTEFIVAGEEVAWLDLLFGYDEAARLRGFLALLLLRMLPIYLMGWVGAAIDTLDTHHRWTQPFANMYREANSASDTLLLDYMTVSPLSVIPQAWTNSHFKVVYFAVLNALNWVPPLIITGLCSVTETGSRAIVQVSPMVACIGLIWSLVYIFSLFSAWPAPKRKLPKGAGNLCYLYSLFYDSKLRWLPEFGHAAFSAYLTKDELHALLRLARSKYLFGLVGEHHNQHPGFDIAVFNGVDTANVRWVEPVPGFRDRAKSTFKRPKHRKRRSDFDLDPDIEEDAISMHEFEGPHSMRRRRQSVGRVAPDGHSSAID